MSKVSVASVKCKTCGKEHKVNIYHSINVFLDHELKDKLLKGELTDIPCTCGLILPLRYPILYHKMGFQSSTMIHFTQLDIEEVKKQHEMAKSFMEGCLPKSHFGISGSDEIIEAYNDWDEFIKRIKEIG